MGEQGAPFKLMDPGPPPTLSDHADEAPVYAFREGGGNSPHG